VGSLYQYFPGKEALVAAVMERHSRELMQVARDTLARGSRRCRWSKRYASLSAAAIKAHRIDPKLHRVLAEQIPRTGKLENIEAFNRERTMPCFRAFLGGPTATSFARVDLRACGIPWCVTSIEALTHGPVLHHSEKRPRTKRLERSSTRPHGS